MSNSIVTSTSVSESAVIDAPLSATWHLIKLQSFAQWDSLIAKVEENKGTSNETDVYRVTYKDGTTADVKQEEHSSIHHYITFSIIAAEPALPFSSVLSTIRCWSITSGNHEGSTFVQYSSTFSGDADAATIQDARFKRKDALKDLAKAVASK